ncbi:beta/gamma crystallin-related protein [Candidatus Poribacteria bacterium]
MTTPYRPTTTYTPTRTPYTTSTPLAPMRPRLVAEIYRDPYFRGPRGLVIDNVRFTGDIGFQDNISSVRVYRGPGYVTSPNYKMIMHEHRDFRGRQLVLGPGYYPDLHDIAYNFGDIISSISFGPSLVTTGPDFGTIPLIVEVYRDVNFQGKKVTVLRDISHTDQIGLHDAISSIRIFRGPNFPPSGCKAIFYEHIEFDGQALEIPLGPLEYHKDLPDLHIHGQFFGDIISSIKLESWVAGGGGMFREVVFLDEFDTMRPVWQWIDPRGDCRRQLGRPQTGGILQDRAGWLEIHVGPNHDLWHGPNGRGGNMDAPRMLQEISGDFALEVKITSSEQRKEHGGILVWKNDRRFVRLDKTSSLHAFRGDIRFETHINRRYSAIGRGKQTSVMNFLRLERTGQEFQAYCSTDGQTWQTCGRSTVVMKDPVMVGMHALCPGNIPPTITRFDYFKIIRPSATSTLGLAQQLPSYGASAATTQRRPRR